MHSPPPPPPPPTHTQNNNKNPTTHWQLCGWHTISCEAFSGKNKQISDFLETYEILHDKSCDIFMLDFIHFDPLLRSQERDKIVSGRVWIWVGSFLLFKMWGWDNDGRALVNNVFDSLNVSHPVMYLHLLWLAHSYSCSHLRWHYVR